MLSMSFRIRDLNSGLEFLRRNFIKYVHLMPNRFSMTSTLTILAVINYDIYYIKSDYRKRKHSKIDPIKDTSKDC